MQVLKFGGSSVANAQNMQRVVDIVCRALQSDRTILVCSAISGCTDTLIRIGHMAAARDERYRDEIDALQTRHNEIIDALLPPENHRVVVRQIEELFTRLRDITQGVYLLGELSGASLDAIQGFGELFSTRIISAKFASLAILQRWVDSREIILTREDDSLTDTVGVDVATTAERLGKMLEQDTITALFVFPGFIAADEQGRTKTLGRGGSDYTASLIAACIKARNLEIWTDVSGMMTANPKIVPTARTIEHISYRAALELSHFGAKVVYPPTIQPVVKQGIPIWVKNTFAPNDYGTLIEQNPPRVQQNIVGISNSDNIALVSLEGSGMVGVPGFTGRLFSALSQHGINIILITQASSVHTLCIAVSEHDAERAKAVADACFAYEISLGKLNPMKVETGYSILCLVGDDVFEHSGATGRMLTALGSHGIRVRATAQGSSERNISVIVQSNLVEQAIRHVHNEFFDRQPEKVVNIFLAGFGTVGQALVQQIRDGVDAIAFHSGKVIRVCGIANSKRYVLDTNGIDLSHIEEALAKGENAADGAYYIALGRLNTKHSVFVDCTASSDVPQWYPDLLRRGYHVVTCNKVGFASSYALYDAIVSEAHRCSRRLRYETTVGSALPVIETLKRLVCSSDKIEHIDALLSGTLGYLFSRYEGGNGPLFSELVAEAKAMGYTEPDPAIDLSGRDVMRKLLIMAREIGVPLEEQDVVQTPIPWQDEEALRALYDAAASRGACLRYLATLTWDGTGYKASIGLKEVTKESAFFNLAGSDNCVAIRSQYYPSPMVIRGAGAGAAQTASGVLNDIILF